MYGAFISDFNPAIIGPGGLDAAWSLVDKSLFWLRVGDVENDQRPIKPCIKSFL
jgi:hypothetical protein